MIDICEQQSYKQAYDPTQWDPLEPRYFIHQNGNFSVIFYNIFEPEIAVSVCLLKINKKNGCETN